MTDGVVGVPAGREQGVGREQGDHRDDDLGQGRAAVVAGVPGGVVDGLVDRGDDLAAAGVPRLPHGRG